MAAYDKSGYSHSETSLVALIYVSSQVRPPRLPPLRLPSLSTPSCHSPAPTLRTQ